MYVDIVPNRNSPPAVLLRESVCVDGQIVKKTLGNLTGLLPEKIAAIRRVLSGKAREAIISTNRGNAILYRATVM